MRTLSMIPCSSIEPNSGCPKVTVKPMSQFSIISYVTSITDDALLEFIIQRIADLPHLPEDEIFTFEAYCSYQSGADEGSFYHHLECKKRYQADDTADRICTCPYCHPDIYLEEGERRGKRQAKMKTGITKQLRGILDRYDWIVARAATYRHQYRGDICLKFAIEDFYLRKIVAAFPRNRIDYDYHSETYICDAVLDSQVVAVAEDAMHELSTLGLVGASLVAPGAAPLAAAPAGTNHCYFTTDQ